jgi:hypothetical protein
VLGDEKALCDEKGARQRLLEIATESADIKKQTLEEDLLYKRLLRQALEEKMEQRRAKSKKTLETQEAERKYWTLQAEFTVYRRSVFGDTQK